MSDWPKTKIIHAIGKESALCGATLYALPMNFAPHSIFGRASGAGQGRRWCALCLELWRQLDAQGSHA